MDNRFSAAIVSSLRCTQYREYDFFKTRTYDFLVYLGKFQEIRATCPCKEIQYTNLFMEFSKIFALKPEVGEIRERRIRIGSQTVVCIPDVRFLRYPQIADHSLLVMHTEVNLIKPSDDQEETFDIHKLTTQTLGLHGGELLAERKFSIFKPGVLGIICLRTKLIFTFMEMTEDHYNCIERGRSCDEHHAKIIYTKPYDYLNEEEREEMYSLLFWLGYLQQCT
ncbi:uncharacterized protein LOC125654794 isoform X3 [Ostrea edulis]|uniref:uncharacterized protein LOC125654794 isoform X3 n=1 Tax=Ostrea edulis TaxID=37623 RepID=UPI002094288B|nr:uncharacterized protein LOC125654794 isoform X3 [Ostrea edulis]